MTRKELVHKLAEHLGVRPVYLAAPSFAYQVGDYTVDRQGNILDSEGQATTCARGYLEGLFALPGIPKRGQSLVM